MGHGTDRGCILPAVSPGPESKPAELQRDVPGVSSPVADRETYAGDRKVPGQTQE